MVLSVFMIFIISMIELLNKNNFERKPAFPGERRLFQWNTFVWEITLLIFLFYEIGTI